MNACELNDEVFVAKDTVMKVARHDVEILKGRAVANERRKCRLLLHRNVDDMLYEMIIIHTNGQYIRPHKNVGSSKSFHIIEGALICVLFNGSGQISQHFTMGEYSGTDIFMIRLSGSYYHTLIPLTDTVIFVETILGPFRGTTYAPWAPEEGDSAEARSYFESLCRKVNVVFRF